MKDNFAKSISAFAYALFLLLFTTSLLAAPARYGYNRDEDTNTVLREMRDSLDALRHEINNHDTELHMFEERVNNQEATIASFRQQVQDSNQANKDLLKGSNSSFDSKIVSLEASNRNIVADLQQLKSHANESSTALTQYKQKMSDLEKLIILQNQNIDSLQAGLQSLVEAIQVKENIGSIANTKGYKIKAGDSLEKIARAHHTTIKAIKELNNLSNDRIIVGQTIQIP